MSQTKSALHRTRLPLLDLKVFSVLIFYKTILQPVPLAGICRKKRTE
jgi:hypothetical protein